MEEIETILASDPADGHDIVLGGVAEGLSISICFIRPLRRMGLRTISAIFDGTCLGGTSKTSVSISFSRWTNTTGTSPHAIASNCSCQRELKAETCEHIAFFLDRADITTQLEHLLSIPCSFALSRKEEGAMHIPQLSKRNYTFWIYFRRIRISARIPNVVLLIEKSPNERKSLVFRQRLRCNVCRRDPSKRGTCPHERIVLEAHELLTEHDEDMDLKAVQEIGDGWEGNADNLDSDLFESQATRPLFRCESDDGFIQAFKLEMGRFSSEDLWRGLWYIAHDTHRKCWKCGKNLCYRSDSSSTDGNVMETKERLVELHTFIDGTVRIQVADLICPSCQGLVPFEGVDSAMFVLNRYTVFSRELLDFWVYQVCGIGLTFREAYEAYRKLVTSTSASLVRSGTPLTCHRKIANTCFTRFLSKLVFTSPSLLAQTFSCSTCEEVSKDGSKTIDAVVIDGTAVGILAALPRFERPTALVPRVNRSTSHQYMLRTPAVRRVLESIYRTASSEATGSSFSIRFARASDKNVVRFLFSEIPKITTDSLDLGRVRSSLNFFQKCFCRTVISGPSIGAQFPGQTEELGESSEEEDEHGLPKSETRAFSVSPLFPSSQLKMSMIDVARCFTANSIPGGVFRDEKSVRVAELFRYALRRFSGCMHNPSICEECLVNLVTISVEHADHLPPVSKLARDLCEAVETTYHPVYRDLAILLADLLLEATKVRTSYLQSFEREASQELQSYTLEHRQGLGMTERMQPENWMDEACRTGDVFPGRPIVRPRIDFGLSSKKENSKQCTKNYRASSSHSPGIFTVQCACRHPKLLGVSVMESCEGVSTALSVMLSRFAKLPRVIYYDNACNLAKSVILRFPWLNSCTRIVSDRFHYKGHICCSVTDPDSYPTHDSHSTSGAESLNRLWNSSKSHSRFLSSENLMPFLCVRAAFLNIRSLYRQITKRRDTEDVDISNFARTQMPCSCSRCQGNLS